MNNKLIEKSLLRYCSFNQNRFNQNLKGLIESKRETNISWGEVRVLQVLANALLVLLKQIVVLDLASVLVVVECDETGSSLEPRFDELQQRRLLFRGPERILRLVVIEHIVVVLLIELDAVRLYLDRRVLTQHYSYIFFLANSFNYWR